MAITDEEFIKRLRATFRVEAEEHLQAMMVGLIELEKSPSPLQAASTIEHIYREAHSLKGAARAVDFQDIEAACQSIEGVFAAWKRKEAEPTAQSFDSLHKSLDAIRAMMAPVAPPASEEQPAEPGDAHSPPPAAPTDTVRISIDKLDNHLLQTEDMLTVKLIAAQHVAQLRAITAMFEQWRQEWGKVSGTAKSMAGPVSHFLDWNAQHMLALENRVGELAAQSDQDRYSIARRVDDLLEDSKKLVMLPFATLSGLLPKLVRDLSREQNKEAELVIQGGDVEIDKRILDEMRDVLTHILRNSIDHGVEPPAERRKIDKPARATISIAVSQVNGSKVEITVSDDGGGIDIERVKAAAVRAGIVSGSQAASLSESEAASLIFHSDVSTSAAVTKLSGRGLGMAIVRGKVEKLGGRLSVQSERHAGTTLRIILPLTLSTFRGILIASGDQTFVIPTMNVERILRVQPGEIQTVENRETISVLGSAVSLVRLDALLQLPPRPKHNQDLGHFVVALLHAGGQRIGFVVDEVRHEEEVLVKPLRRPLVRVRNVAGVTVLGSGVPVPILNVTDLMLSARQLGSPPSITAAPQTHATAAKKILIAEDSITSRMLLKGILEAAGYQVKVAVDGIDAFSALREGDFDLIVSDVEMPRMNGFDLTSRIRADRRLSELPVVLVTALESPEHRERGIDAGANAYVVKSRFDQSNLLEVIHRLI